MSRRRRLSDEWGRPDPFWTIIHASYSESELYALAAWAEELERLERERIAQGWRPA
jgi:hypothetical protein